MELETIEKLKIYCPTHQIVFEFERKPQIICEVREHALANDFPQSEFWEFCCDCRTFSPSRYGTGGKAGDTCPHCDRPTARRFLCGECKVVSYDSDENTKGKICRVNHADGIEPDCPGCGKSVDTTIHPHDCSDIEGTLLTGRSECPFCQKAIVNNPPTVPANVFQTGATGVESGKKSGSTQCPKCGNWGIAERIHCGKCGTRINDLGESVTPGSTVPRTQLLGSICPNCGAGNQAESVFCNNCGQALKIIRQVERLDDINRQTTDTTTAALDFRPPPTFSPAKTSSNDAKTIAFVLAGVLLLGVIIGTLVAFNNNSPSTVNSNTSSNNATVANSSNTNRSMNSNSRIATNSDSALVGRQGRLITNAHIRSASTKDAASLGTHYEDARLEILETDSYTTSDGYSTWYRVKVLQDGCDRKEGKGCGNNWERPGTGSIGWMEAAREGWMNAKNIVLE